MKKQVFGFDIGIASIGWSVLNFDNEKFDPETGEIQEGEIKGVGVRCFSGAENPKDGSSLATPRREKRLARRACRRKARRMQDLKNAFVEAGLTSFEKLATLYIQEGNKDVWNLRVEALDRLLSKEELVRVLTHLAKHRGFKSYRKSAEKQDKEMGEVLKSIQANAESGIKSRTLAEAIVLRSGNGAKRNRVVKDPKTGKNQASYINSIPREEIRKEINLIYEKQKEGYFSKSLYDKIVGSDDDTNPKTAGIIFRHRDIQGVGDMVGFCPFEKEEKRAPKEAPSAELFVALTKINHFSVFENQTKRFLTSEEKNLLLNLLYETENVKYQTIRKKLFSKKEGILFVDIDYEKDKEIKEVENKAFYTLKGFHAIRKAVSKEEFEILKKDIFLLDQIVTIIAMEKTDLIIQQKLKELGLSVEIAEKLSDLSFKKFLHLSLKAIYNINPYLTEGLKYNEACEKAGYDFKSSGDSLVEKKGVLLGPIKPDMWTTVPTVNRAVSQFRKVYNAIVRKYGEPDEIHIELARDMYHSRDELNRIKKEQDAFRVKKENALKALLEHGFENKGSNLLKYRLYEEQQGKCIYSGLPIDINRLCETGYCEIDHILPYSRSLDDSLSNKVLCLTKENQQKTNQTPFEYLSSQNKWDDFVGRVNALHLNKAKRNRLLRVSYTDADEDGFKERNINDTRYMARYIKQYLEEGIDFSNSKWDIKNRVRCVNGSLTAFLRHKWGIDKDRNANDLHHAQDAVVIACATQKMVQYLSFVSARFENKFAFAEKKKFDHWYEGLKRPVDTPWTNFREDVLSSLKTIFVSRAPRHKITGEAHAETIVTVNPQNQKYNASKVKSGVKVRGGLASNGSMVRTDVFSKKNKKGKEEFYLVPVYVTDTIKKDLPNKAVVANKTESEWIEMDETFTFKFSLFLDDYIKIKKGGEEIEGYFIGMDRALGQISIMSHDRSYKFVVVSKKVDEETSEPIKKIENTYKTGAKSLDYIKKFVVSPLGELSEVKNEKRMTFSLKKKSKK